MAGVMNLVRMSVSVSSFLFMRRFSANLSAHVRNNPSPHCIAYPHLYRLAGDATLTRRECSRGSVGIQSDAQFISRSSSNRVERA
jgi:hypothetical protein